MIIGFPSFIAFFKSPAKPRKEEKSSSKYFAKQTDERSTLLTGKWVKCKEFHLGYSSICKHTMMGFWCLREKRRGAGRTVERDRERFREGVKKRL